MNILVTGAKGFVVRNLVENLKTIQDGRNSTRPNLSIDAIYEYDLDTDPVIRTISSTSAIPRTW